MQHYMIRNLQNISLFLQKKKKQQQTDPYGTWKTLMCCVKVLAQCLFFLTLYFFNPRQEHKPEVNCCAVKVDFVLSSECFSISLS